ncbi:TetR family transcriptional regulator [Streptomyces tsukubensis]|nr:TetR family transcriptional regulator [Streptomyces tsukubensis]
MDTPTDRPGSTASPTDRPAPKGLRERKKQRTRDALLRAALELFTANGYEQTTVDEIAGAVDVSQRTFFRYFASKEEAAFAVQEMVEGIFLASLRERPAHEPPFEALRGALADAWRELAGSIERIIPVELHMRTCRMIECTPSLLATHLRRSIEREEEVAQVIAAREGLDPATDPRPRVAVAAFGGVMRVTGRLWGTGGDISVESVAVLTESHLDRLGPALVGQWRAPSAGHRAGTAALAPTTAPAPPVESRQARASHPSTPPPANTPCSCGLGGSTATDDTPDARRIPAPNPDGSAEVDTSGPSAARQGIPPSWKGVYRA